MGSGEHRSEMSCFLSGSAVTKSLVLLWEYLFGVYLEML